MGKLRKYNCRFRIFLAILFVALVLGGCGKASTETSDAVSSDKQASAAEVSKEDNAEDEKAQEIPESLLPGQTEAEDGQASAQEGMEIVGEDGKVYSAGKSSSADSGTSGAQGGSSGSSSSNSQNRVIHISFSIESSNAGGVVSYAADMTLDKGATVYDALAASGVAYSGKSYIKAIGGLAEKAAGSESGWKYYVNGAAPNTSCVNCVLNDGDNVQWSYVLNS